MRQHSDRASRKSIATLCASVAFAVGAAACSAQTMQAPDITKDPTLYVAPYAHLDTQWRWEFPQVISEYLLKTMRVNFNYMDKYPHYVFNWTGSNRYRLMKEYYPDDYARMKQYVAKGQWFPAGSSVEEGDVNLPTAEGIFRQVLYGNMYFRHEFGKASNEYMLPDCFGFPASLPSILAHAGVKGFSTQKLNAAWQPAPKIGGPGSPEETPEGIPFNVGLWIGPDGSRVMAALNPSSYNSQTYTDLSNGSTQVQMPSIPQAELDGLTARQKRTLQRLQSQKEPNWVERIQLDGKVTGVFADYHYVGTGDIGGAAEESSIRLLEATVQKQTISLPLLPDFIKTPASAPVRVGEGPVHVVISAADQMFNDIKPELTSRMPTYKGDLELINHSAGSLTSQAYHKRWVAKNELLADAAEKASLAAAWMGAQPYPQQRLNDAWTLALGGHFHDTAAGTATPRSYEFAWNDDILTANQFASVFTSATASISSALDTSGPGTPLILFNALNIPREDLVEAALPASTQSKAVHVVSADGAQIPAQITGGKVLFAAKLPSVGYAVYHVVPGAAAGKQSELKATSNSLENARYRVQVNSDGDVSSIFDKQIQKELLMAPVRLALSLDKPQLWPAWNMDFDQEQAAPRDYVGGPAAIRIKENGPVRVSLEVTREHEGSKYVQTISLAAGDAGNRVEFHNAIDWRGKDENLKVTFPLSASNENATYNEDLGTIERPNAFDRQFEVLSHRWIDLTDKSGSYGITLLTDTKNGSDKRDDHTLRLTLLRSPGISAKSTQYSDQENQDWGHHEFSFGLAGHANGWREAQTDWQGQRLHDPIRVFSTTAHAGSLGKQFSLLHIDNPRVRVLALKKAEETDELVLRMVELDGKPTGNVHVSFAGSISAAREINAQEQPVGEATVTNGQLVASFNGYQPRTFALKLAAPSATATTIASQPVTLPYDLATATEDDVKTSGGGFDGKGNAYPAEMLPSHLSYAGVNFDLARASSKTPNAVVANGQTISLPAGNFNRIYILAAADGDQTAEFRVGNKVTPLTVENWGGFIGQWDTRLWKMPEENWAISAHHAAWPPADMDAREAERRSPRFPDDYLGLREGYIKPAPVAWYASHHHTPEGLNDPYAYSYLFTYALDLPAGGARQLTLPKNNKVRILAVSVAQDGPSITAATPLFDTLQHTSEPVASARR